MKQKNIKRKLQEYFFKYPTAKLRVREIERTLKLSLPSIIRYCKEMESEGILVTVKIGSVTFYTANKGNSKYQLEKKLYNIRTLYESGLIGHIKKELSNPGIVLFGSFLKGEDTEESDIDLYIETLSRKKLKLGKFKKLLNREIQIFQQKNLQEISNPHLANNIVNGMTVNKFIEVF